MKNFVIIFILLFSLSISLFLGFGQYTDFISKSSENNLEPSDNKDIVEDITSNENKVESNSGNITSNENKVESNSENLLNDDEYLTLLTEIETLDTMWLEYYEKYLYDYATNKINRYELVSNYKEFKDFLVNNSINNEYKNKMLSVLDEKIFYINNSADLSYYDIIRYSETQDKVLKDFKDSIIKNN